MTLHAGYAASRISSDLKGSTNKFGWLQAPRPTLSNTSGRSKRVALPASTKTSTNRVGQGSTGLPSAIRACDILCHPSGPTNYHLVCIGAIKRREAPVADCRSVAMQNSAQDVSSPLLNEKQAAQNLMRSASSLRRDRRRAPVRDLSGSAVRSVTQNPTWTDTSSPAGRSSALRGWKVRRRKVRRQSERAKTVNRR